MAKPDAPIMPEKAKKFANTSSTRNDKTSLPKEVRDFIAAQESGSIQDLYDQGVIKGKPPKNMEEGGMAISDRDIASVRRAFGSPGESGNTLSGRDIEAVRRILAGSGRRRNRRRANESANTISDRDIQMLMRSIGMEDGGEAVPTKFKGFSKLLKAFSRKWILTLLRNMKRAGLLAVAVAWVLLCAVASSLG